MKKILKLTLLLGFLFIGSHFADCEEKTQTCFFVPVDCGNGKGSIALVCGTTTMDILIEVDEMARVICN
jgi:hypothetical protein